MKVVFDIPDAYLFRWNDLKDKMGLPTMDSFILNAIGIGIKTIDQAINMWDDKDNVIPFDKDYYWKDFLDNG